MDRNIIDILEKIETNKNDIDTNKNDIIVFVDDLSINADNISTNADNIETNIDAIATNKKDIANIKKKLAEVFCLECGNRDQYTCQKHIVFEKAPISYTFTYISCLIKNKNNDCPDFTTEIKVYPLSELIITEEKNLNNGG